MHDTVCYVNGELLRKSEAKISIYDSGFQHGDGVYEGIRVYNDRVFMLDEHIQRLYESCKAIDIRLHVSPDEMREIVLKTLRANPSVENVHMRLQVTRGAKTVTGMNPKLNYSDPSIVLCVDHKPPVWNKSGVKLITASIRRSPPSVLDTKIHSCNQLNQILACIEANRQNADEPIMLDINGFVAETAGTTMFMAKGGILYTPTENYILPGITRRLVMTMARARGIPVVERDITVTEFYNADEAFITGTQGEITPIAEIDGRSIGLDLPGPLTIIFSDQYRELINQTGVPIR
jgi:branched-chain amino acid aminotransferase